MKIKNCLFVVAVAAMIVSCGGRSQQKLPTDDAYAVTTVGTSNADLQTTYPATIKGIQDVEIRPKISGFITKVCVHEGQTVKAGQLLFVIDNVTYQAAARQAQAAVSSAKTQMNTARMTYLNNQKLFKNNVIGQYELETSRNTYESAKSAVAQAEAALVSARQNLDFCYVTSPASGVVGDLPFKEGALVSASSVEPLTTVSNISNMEVYFSMSEKDILNLTKTAGSIQAAISSFPAVKLQLADGTIYNHPGKVTKISGVIDATTGSYSIIARFANPQHLLKSGGAGQIVVPGNGSNSIVIPQEAVSQVQNKYFVYIVGSDNKVKYTEITVNPQNDGNNYIVMNGLHVGDRIVSRGISSLTNGQKIKPLSEADYAKHLKEQEELSKGQGSAAGFIDAMKK